jgi:hypothetical protein
MTTKNTLVSSVAFNAFGSAVYDMAVKATQIEAGAIKLAHLYGPQLQGILAKLQHARKDSNDETVRDTCLQFWLPSAAGIAFTKEKNALPTPKQRTDQQRTRAVQLRKIENKVALGIERACDTLTGMNILKTTRLVQVLETATGSDVFGCYVRSETKLKEMQNFEFNATQLQAVPANAKRITDKTSTKDVLALCGGGPRKGKAGKAKGGKVERIPNAKLAEAFTALDTAIAAYTKPDGVGFASGPDAQKAADMLFARLYNSMTPERRNAALIAYAEEAKAYKAKVKAVKKPAPAAVPAAAVVAA